jgi:hypothetical protein
MSVPSSSNGWRPAGEALITPRERRWEGSREARQVAAFPWQGRFAG